MQEFHSIISGRVLSEATEVESYNIDWLRNFRCVLELTPSYQIGGMENMSLW